MYSTLKTYIEQLAPETEHISDERKEILSEIAGYIRNKQDVPETVKLMFICTHNSRRSHLAQVWSAAISSFLHLDKIENHSAGTEATAFNPRAIAALERAGFNITKPEGENLGYEVKYTDHMDPLICFSKTIGHASNPSKNFAAIMTCSDADENCPFVPGAEFRVSLPYRDPKESDATSRESRVYDERCKQIAAELFFMLQKVKQQG